MLHVAWLPKSSYIIYGCGYFMEGLNQHPAAA